MKETLKAILPKILPETVTTIYVVFNGKKDLERSIPAKLKGWRDSYHQVR